MKPLKQTSARLRVSVLSLTAKVFQVFAVVMLLCGHVVAADGSVSPENAGVISREALFLEHPDFKENFDRYQALEHAVKVPTDVNVLIFFGTWCHDSQREVPRMLKILEAVGLPADNIEMVTLDYSKTAPGGRAVANAIEFTPTFIFFRHQTEIGRIVEKPATSLEEAISELLVQQ